MERNIVESALADYVQALYEIPADRSLIVDGRCFEGRQDLVNNIKAFAFWDQTRTYTRELILNMNLLVVRLHQLQAWERVLKTQKSSEDELGLLVEYVEPVLLSVLSSPYTLRNRFIFCSVKLINLAAIFRDHSTAKVNDRKIDLAMLNKMCVGTSVRERFKKAVGELNSSEIINGTRNFRHRREHQLPQHMHLGIQPFIDTECTEEGFVIRMMVDPALRIEDVLPIIPDEHQRLKKALDAFWELVWELDSELPPPEGSG